ncbi:MAG: phosphohexomutase domain-containing protein [Candidatus Latescibacterota bacterium]
MAMNETRLPAFKAYDIRGKIPGELNEAMAYKIGRAYVAEMGPQGAVAVGRDVRETSVSLSRALIRGLNDAGVDAVDIGLCGTEMVYFASSLEGMGGGAMITASHNPKDYNGIKLVRSGAQPISEDTGLLAIERRVRSDDLPELARTRGETSARDIMKEYARKVLSFVDAGLLKPLKILVNPGNGCAGPALDILADSLPFEFIRINFQPDGSFPNGIPNPLLIENRDATADAVREQQADLGIAWDGDFDRCFFFNERGEYIEGYYIVGFLAKRILNRNPGGKIVHDPRLIWNTVEMVKAAGGTPVLSKSGHSFIKEKMRETGAIYGGEMSAHHYFRDFSYSDSGMIPWLLVAEEMSVSGKKFSELVKERIRMYPCSGEINRTVANPDTVVKSVEEHFSGKATAVSHLDGITMEFGDTWRFNLRKSNTEPVVRLNVESSGDEGLMKARTEEILTLIEAGVTKPQFV